MIVKKLKVYIIFLSLFKVYISFTCLITVQNILVNEVSDPLSQKEKMYFVTICLSVKKENRGSVFFFKKVQNMKTIKIKNTCFFFFYLF